MSADRSRAANRGQRGRLALRVLPPAAGGSYQGMRLELSGTCASAAVPAEATGFAVCDADLWNPRKPNICPRSTEEGLGRGNLKGF